MQSAMETPTNVFLCLSALLEILKDGMEPCLNKTAKTNLEPMKESFGHLFAILNDPDRKFHDKDGAFNAVLAELIKRCLCRSRHYLNSDDAKSQWLKELYNDEKRHHLRCKLQIYLSEGSEEESVISTPPSETEFELCSSKTSPRKKHEVQLLVTYEVFKPLTETDREPGFIYLISHPREPKMFKIGHTIDLEQRFAKHKRCYKGFGIVKTDFIPYVYRIEQLIIAEYSLQHYKLKEKCIPCDQSHKEWLQVSEARVVKSFKKWVQFAKAEKRPYDENGCFKSKTVVLPPPAMVFNSPASTAKKSSRRRSDGTPSQESSPSKPDPNKSNISIIEEEISNSSFDDGYSTDAGYSGPISCLADRFAAIRMN
ncbi:unnamed protein product [Penicillium glandicola]